jgi:hypothetical protein
MDSIYPLSKPILSGHEKFVFRHGWLKKGVDAAARDPQVFSDDQALVLLGVGKNMVRSIRHWCLASGLLAEDTDSRKGSYLHPTNLAILLLSDQGWDPYLEDPGTLWLLHWQLTSDRVRGVVWRIIFGLYYEPEFSKRQLISHVTRHFEKYGINSKPSTIEQNVDICLRTYVPALRTKTGAIAEDTFDCPLADLDLIRFVPEDGVYCFNIGPKGTLSPAIFGYALLRYLPEVIQQRQTLSVEDCIYRPNSPGQIFKLDENSVIEMLETLEEITDGSLRLQETAGIRQIYLSNLTVDDFTQFSYQLLNQYYARHDF